MPLRILTLIGGFFMTKALIDAMTALGAQLKATTGVDNSAHLAAIDDHLTQLDAKETQNEADNETNTEALQALVDGYNAAPAATPQPTPVPTPNPAAGSNV